MKNFASLVVLLLVSIPCLGQSAPAPAPHRGNRVVRFVRHTALDVGRSSKDFILWKDPAMNFVRLFELGAALYDMGESLDVLRRCPGCQENPLARLFVGRRPNAGRYTAGALTEWFVAGTVSYHLRNDTEENSRARSFWPVLPVAFGSAHSFAGVYSSRLCNDPKTGCYLP